MAKNYKKNICNSILPGFNCIRWWMLSWYVFSIAAPVVDMCVWNDLCINTKFNVYFGEPQSILVCRLSCNKNSWCVFFDVKLSVWIRTKMTQNLNLLHTQTLNFIEVFTQLLHFQFDASQSPFFFYWVTTIFLSTSPNYFWSRFGLWYRLVTLINFSGKCLFYSENRIKEFHICIFTFFESLLHWHMIFFFLTWHILHSCVCVVFFLLFKKLFQFIPYAIWMFVCTSQQTGWFYGT